MTLTITNAAYALVLAADRATDKLLHEEIANIVKLHAKLSIGAAWIPFPGADLAAMATNTWTMYVRINQKLDIPFSENVIKSIASGIGSNVLSNVPAILVAEGIKTIPGFGTITGSAAMSAGLYTATITAGILYMKALAMLLSKQSDLTEVELLEAVNTVTRDPNTIKNIFTIANSKY